VGRKGRRARGEDPDGPAIDAMLDRELEEWQDTIEERIRDRRGSGLVVGLAYGSDA